MPAISKANLCRQGNVNVFLSATGCLGDLRKEDTDKELELLCILLLRFMYEDSHCARKTTGGKKKLPNPS